MGLSRSEVSGVPGTSDSIGAFITTNTAVRYGSYPFGTTDSYLSNNSSAVLTMPAGSTVMYAELIWGGTYLNGSTNLTSAINNPVVFITPAGTTSVTPDSATNNQFDLGGGALGYVRSANVTSLVQQGGAGTYNTGRVVGTLVISGDATANNAGWTLAVIYSNTSLPFRNMSLRAGAILVQASSAPVTNTITGFATPTSGAVGARALFSAQEGDANRTGDQALFGATTASLVALSGPNNFANNFFASQINNNAGQLDTTGTFGTRNQTNGAPGSNISGGRQGWDITNVDVSSSMVNNQTSAVLRLTTSGDAYVLNANAIQININDPLILVSKSANRTGSLVGDTIIYTVTVNNTGTASATNMIVTDTPPAGSTFIAGSVVVGGVPRPTFDIVAGVPIGTLAPGASVVVSYSVSVTSLPSNQQIVNTANASFSFQAFSGGPIVNAIIPSNAVSTPVYSPILTMNKSANTSNATVGSTVTYTIQTTNSGNIAATTTISDPIPAGTAFVPNSVTVNGVAVPGANIATGVAVGSIGIGAVNTVTFQVVVQTLPSPPQLVNQAAAAYTFLVPDGRTSSGSTVSNTVTIPVSLPNLAAVKSANVTDAAVGETITYTTVMTNSGIASLTNVVLTDPLPSGAIFVGGSVTVNGSPRPSASPASGINLGTMAPGSSITVTFQVTSASLPPSANFVNQASIAYSSGAFNGITLTNTVTIPLYQPVITATKSVNQSVATVGDTLTYTVFVNNTGNIAAQITLTDTIPAGTSFVPGSVTVNTLPVPGASPITGISLGSVAPASSVPVTFQFLLNTLPSPARLTNQATATYSFQLPSGRTFSGLTALSNIVDIPAASPSVTVTKGVNSTAATLNDILTYTVVVTNGGAQTVNNAVLSDTIPSGTVFVSGSVAVNGVSRPSADPTTGVSLGSMSPGASLTVTFSVRVASVAPTIPALLNNQASVSFTSGAFTGSSTSPVITTSAYLPVITIVKTPSASTVTVGDTFSYSLQITNSGNFPADVTVTDILPVQATFVENSVIINGFPNPGVNPATGIPLDTISAGETYIVSFSVVVVSIPSPQFLVNSAAADYDYTLPGGRVVLGSAASNITTVAVSAPNVSVVKSSNAGNAVSGDNLVYTSVVTNNGLSPVNNTVLSDSIQQGSTFVSGSVIVNGISQPLANPAVGIPIGTLAPSASATVTFEVIISMAVPPIINNQSAVSFTSGVFAASSQSNTISTPVIQPVISMVKTANTSVATLGDTIIYTIAVSNTGNLAAQLTLTDIIPAGTTFSPNSVVVGGATSPGSDPATGINVGTVAAGATVLVTFEVVVTSLPSPQQLSNLATSTYTFVPPDGRTLTGNAASNVLTFPVSAPNVSIVKSTTTTNTTIGDTISYTLVVTNSGIVSITNAVVADPTPAGAAFIPGTVFINGVLAPTAFPPAGILIGTIAPSASTTITFSINVVSLPSPAVISNQASVNFNSGAFAGVNFSNIIATPVNQPVLSAVKTAGVSTATVGDTLSYTIAVTNSGNFGAAATVTDNIPAGTSLVPNSVIVNGVPVPGASPATGIPAGIILPGSTVNVTFSVLIDFLPTPQQLTNQAAVAFQYTLPDGRPFSGSITSNTLVVSVTAPNVSVVKTTPSTSVAVGDTITYSVLVSNNGISTINSAVLTDPIPTGTALVPGSVTVGGVPRPDANPATGVTLGSIAAGGSIPVTFSITVTTLPNPATISNQAFVSFTSGSFSVTAFSAIVTTPVFQPIMSVLKSSSSTNATVGDTIVYTSVVSNSGNYSAAVTLTDLIPAGTTLVPNSVILNGASQPGADPAVGIPMGIIAPGVPSTVTFSVIVTSLPVTQQLVNQSVASFVFTLPDGRTLSGSAASNTVTTPVSSPLVASVKSTTFTAASVGDVVPYTVTVTNGGIQNVTDVVLVDNIPAGSVFVAGSVTVNGTPVPAANPTAGIQLGTITPGATTTVTFSISVTSLPPSGVLSNNASVSFTSGAFTGASLSNTVNLPVYVPIITAVKGANVTVATVGDTIVYFVNITNTGNIAATATMTDPVPAGGDFVPNSVIINGVPQPGIDPDLGIPLGIIPPGGTITVTVTLQVAIATLPPSQQLVNQVTVNYSFLLPDGRTLTGSSASNTVVIPVSSPDVSVVKSTPAIDAVSGDIITYTIAVTNNGISTVNNVVLVDPIPVGTSFVAGSVTVNGTPSPSDNPGVGISIGSIAAGVTVIVTFQVLVLS
ncbi:MAG: hypothetical protein K0R57_6017 [Paenibacillaceae bacterium]|jgi:uncharacterized repeat protein (TIGR01451 family)|nr:hypothetical protein [Paenibacillaceae bacterium]